MRKGHPIRLIGITIAAAAAMLAASCASLSLRAPERSYFAIDAGRPATAAPRDPSAGARSPGRHDGVLQVRRLRVASPYDGTGFIYRMSGGEFRTDYYNGFIAAPDRLLTGEVIQWLSSAGPFDSVVDGASTVPARYVLEGNVVSLYGDYADRAAPKAVMAMRVFLLDEKGAEPRVLFYKEYDAAVPIQIGSVGSLVNGWGGAFRRVLEELSADLSGAKWEGK